MDTIKQSKDNGTKGKNTTSPAVKEMERENNFMRLCDARVNRLLKQIEIVGNLNGPAYRHAKQSNRMQQVALVLVKKIEGEILPKKDTASTAFKIE